MGFKHKPTKYFDTCMEAPIEKILFHCDKKLTTSWADKQSLSLQLSKSTLVASSEI